MLTDQLTIPLSKYRIRRTVARQLTPMPQSGRLPRYRVFIPNDFKDLLVGSTIAGRYYVLSVLGSGGMSVVYKGKSIDPKHRHRIVAVKTLRTKGLGDELLVKRFQREAELLSHLNHPRIVQVHDYGYTKRGQPYFVMDYLIGQDLASVIKRQGALSPERVRNIFNQVCGAVDHAHRCGVIHRDLKPGNIMLMEVEGQKDYVKVVDFGIARFEEEAQRLTRIGEVWGSPIYMSPEQCMGGQLDARSDVYSLGIVMYEALTGEIPFLGKNYVETMSKQIGDPPRPFSVVRPDLSIPYGLEAAVFKALQKDPAKRCQSTAELRQEIEAAFESSKISGLPTGLPSKSQNASEEAASAGSRSKNSASQDASNQGISNQRISNQRISNQRVSNQRISSQRLSKEVAPKQEPPKPTGSIPAFPTPNSSAPHALKRPLKTRKRATFFNQLAFVFIFIAILFLIACFAKLSMEILDDPVQQQPLPQ